MLEIIQYNPYRILGVYSNATKKEIVANIARIKANLRVERQISFPSDLEGILSAPQRTIESIANAESQLTLPQDNIRHAQFWFIENNELDKIALNNLSIGAFDKAVSIWEKKENVTSLHNRIVAYLIKEDYKKAIELAVIFYSKYSSEFCHLIVGNEYSEIASKKLEEGFLDRLCSEIGASEISQYVTNKEWREFIGNKIITPIIDDIDRCISNAKGTKGKEANVRLESGKKLMSDTHTLLLNLKNELTISNPKYQIIADKLGLAILQCGIDYYNDSDDDDAAYKAMKLQKYAQSIVVGKMAKDRCNENVKILEGIISKLPPLEVMDNHRAIQSFLILFASQPDKISYSIQLLKSCAPHVVSIKEKLGSNNTYYLKISTSIINNALGNIIAEVNENQEEDFNILKETLISAWRAQLYMDKFDLEENYKEGRYKESRKALHGIISQCKGFDNSSLSILYQYGCGWCNDLDVSDLDLRTEDEYYQSCNNLTSLSVYLKKYPSGKYISQAKSRIEHLTFVGAKTADDLCKFIQQYPRSQYLESAKKKIVELRFKECKSIKDYQQFINDFPNSNLISKAQQEIDRLTREENERKIRIARQEKALSTCKTTSDVVDLYESEKTKRIDIDKCSSRAFDLAKNEDDYRLVVNKFGIRTLGGQKAKTKVNEIEARRKQKSETRSKILKRSLWIIIPLIVLVVIYFIWDVRGIARCCTLFAGISIFITIGAMQSRDGCGLSLICAIIALIFGISSGVLDDVADNIEDEKKSKKLYEEIVSNPSEQSCSEYIQKYSNTIKADEVRDIWLDILLNKAKTFDYESFKESSTYGISSNSNNPIKQLQEYISKNEGNTFGKKALVELDLLCDSLYKVADNKGTSSGWKLYQSLVPTDYFKDSEEKKEEIENKAWNTEAKAWKIAQSENSISAYTKYKNLYPKGAHINLCEKRLIDLEVSQVYAGDHGSLPEMDRTGYGGGPTSYIKVTNSTSYTLTLLYSGPDSKRLVIPAGRTSSIELKNGSYRVAASVSAANVSNYAGNENLKGGSYSVDYYISSYRY